MQDLQHIKMAWLAAEEAGDKETQRKLLLEYPQQQDALIDFITGYYATIPQDLEENTRILDVTRRACETAFERVFGSTSAPVLSLAELRKSHNLKKVEVARSLRLSVDVWNKFEAGAIELASLSKKQLERFAGFFQISIDQFAQLLTSSQPSLSINRRQRKEAARKEQQGAPKQSFTEAIARSDMSEEDRRYWLEDAE
ncbi:hypothetical protein EI42_06151 [Thermosporothrix hazakensis]|jgi:transcriptional regulator with XRE-family HTH domain|uniref:HTH cro/C1-type domain-containing protein n=1 Tax=Thermosporothrix hazakensis TaxID=644383 RepID=A0A326TTZ4_THEHA|nr:helix-turn-helix transcriptional regulator [Thermosporothrix hazakensis]PZW19338.1 hypothetical protein EI42_06151 [Thermosporothrix hazakensis]GCE48224.1 hypothetical protein KTH_30930 [Thermosporothrix hazakensis]